MSDAAPIILTATDLVVRYNDNVVLNGATLALHEGDRIGLVGRNGSGKSTFLKILAGQHVPDAGEVTQRRDLVISYLSQDFTLDPDRTVLENVRDGARHVLDLIARFESLPADSKHHGPIEERIGLLDGWGLDHRIPAAMSHLNVPDGSRLLGTLSGGEKRRVALCRAIVSRPDLLILDEPTNHLDPESIEWVADFLDNFPGTFLIVTHDRYFLDRVTETTVELANGRFYSYDGGYTEYLVAKAEREAAEETVEHKRQMFLRHELEWVRRGPSAQRKKAKNRIERYFEIASGAGPRREEEMDLVIPPPPQLGNRVVEVINLGMSLGGRELFHDFNFTFENGQRLGVAGRNGLGKTTLLRLILGQIAPTQGTIKTGQLTKFNYVDQGRLQLTEENTVFEEISDGAEFVLFGEEHLSLRGYLRRFLFSDERINTQVKYLSGGERSRLVLACILKNGGNFLILDEPTNDLDLPTLRVLEEALIAFPGVVLVVSHDRYFLNRVCTGIFAFEGDGLITHSVGNYDYYLEKRARTLSPGKPSQTGRRLPSAPAVPAPSSERSRRLSFKEARELEGMEMQILALETNIARIEALFATPDFHRTHGAQTNQMVSELGAAKEQLIKAYARWEWLEAMKEASPPD
ncbi:MAG: energy-dependent translational throttle protein EttA [Verrucomicrobiota bacterium]